jgi:hypothetical protein
MIKSLATLLGFALLAGCASHSKIVEKPLPEIKRIAVIPASNPRVYTLENATPPIGYPGQYWVNKNDSRAKQNILNDEIQLKPQSLGDLLTEKVVAALRSRGLVVEVLESFTRPADDPDNVDYDKISSDADAILHLWISEVGLYSSHTSVDYVPRVNAGAKLFVKGREDNVYSEDIYYGVDARKGKDWAIVPDPKYAYRSFNAVVSNMDEVRASFTIGVTEIGERMSDQIYRSIPK